MKNTELKTKIFCIGNTLFGDDGIAIFICKELKTFISNSNIEIIEIGPYIHNIPLYTDNASKIILVDAVYGFGEEGNIIVLRGLENINNAIKKRKAYSLHSLNIDIILENIFLEETPFSKNDITLIGIEHRPKNTFQIGISENLKKIIPKVISIICEETKNKCK